MPSSQREHSLDAARGVLMGLGVVLHAANIYDPAAFWLVSDPQSHPAFGWLVSFINVFRMPAFFWISGYFCAMTFGRRGARALFTTRTPRLLIPLLSTAVLLNLGQDLLSGWHRGEGAQQVLAAGLHLHHLWFLVDLLVGTLLAVALLPWAQKLAQHRHGCAAPGWPWLVLICGLAAYTIEAAARLSGAGYISLLGLTSLVDFARYLPYFVGGLFMYLLPAVRDRFVAMPRWLFVPAVLCALSLQSLSGSHPRWLSEVAHAAYLATTWLCVGALLGLFGHWFRTPSALTRLLSESAYSVYLFHHLLVVALGLALLPLAIGPWFKFVLVFAMAGGLALAVHLLLVRPVRIVRYLFNGK